jgi:hypothetical protein
MAHDVFISYSTKDKSAADAACAALEAEGIRCWIAPRDILPGQEYPAAIVKAISETRVFVLLLSGSANASPQISREVERAVNRGAPVIPVRLEDVKPTASLEYLINTPQWLDAFTPPLEPHLAYLTRVVRTLLGEGDAPASTVVPSDRAPAASEPPPAARPSLAPRPAILAGVAVLGLAAVGAAVSWFLFMRGPPQPKVDSACLVEVSSSLDPNTCRSLLSQNATWQNCAAAYAQGDMATLAKRAQTLVSRGQTGDYIYSDGEFQPYGRISHYWEMFSQCVVNPTGGVKFDDIVGGISFPDAFWNRSQPIRDVVGPNWNGPNQAMPGAEGFMWNFSQLCSQYKAWRDKQTPGAGASLNCAI